MRIPGSFHPDKRRNVRHGFGWKIRDHSYRPGDAQPSYRGCREYRLPRYSCASRKRLRRYRGGIAAMVAAVATIAVARAL